MRQTINPILSSKFSGKHPQMSQQIFLDFPCFLFGLKVLNMTLNQGKKPKRQNMLKNLRTKLIVIFFVLFDQTAKRVKKCTPNLR